MKEPSYMVAIDGTAVVPVREKLSAHGTIMGGVYLHHSIEIPENIDSNRLRDLIFDKTIQLALEVKVAVLSFQSVPNGVTPYFVLVGCPQGKNESSNFNKTVMKTLYEESGAG
jgi:hypothetical protein